MDPGRVVWLPGGGFDENLACQVTFGYDSYDCGSSDAPGGGIYVYCCSY